jgi:N-acetyl-gamma-glutamyl-phosphate reductase
MNSVLRVGIVGAGGYTGAELVRLIHAHPRLELVWVAAAKTAGQRLGDVLPSLIGLEPYASMVLDAFDPSKANEVAARVDVAFLALPHAASALVGAALLAAGVRVVDLSADFRLRDVEVYRAAYGEHPHPELLAQAVYGQPELHRRELAGARLIAAPGCYPTSAILPLFPLLKAGLVEPTGIIIDSKSGVSGAGKSPSAATHFAECSEGMRAYKVGGVHRHVPEIEQELSLAAGTPIKVVFTPHLVPMTRGIHTTAYARLKPGTTAELARETAKATYGRGLVTVLPEGKLPDTLWVRGSCRAMISYVVDEHTQTLVALSVIDNLARGASAQAVQALNVALGWTEELGLPVIATFP